MKISSCFLNVCTIIEELCLMHLSLLVVGVKEKLFSSYSFSNKSSVNNSILIQCACSVPKARVAVL